MAISTIGQNGLTVPLTSNTITSASATALTLQSAGTTAVTIDTSQNVGIGGAVTNEGGYSRCLQVTGATEAALELKGGSSYSYVAQNGTNLQIRNNDASGAMTFATNATERMRIDSSGNLLVGLTANSYNSKLTVQSDASAVTPFSINDTSTGSTSRYIATWYRGGSSVGNISITNTTTAYNTSSDYRLKNTIAPMTGALAKVALLKPVTYKWNYDNSDGEGFIAHELAEVCPHAVTGEKDAVDAEGNPQYQGIDVSFLVATLTAALQETKALIDQQAETINALTARIEALENK